MYPTLLISVFLSFKVQLKSSQVGRSFPLNSKAGSQLCRPYFRSVPVSLPRYQQAVQIPTGICRCKLGYHIHRGGHSHVEMQVPSVYFEQLLFVWEFDSLALCLKCQGYSKFYGQAQIFSLAYIILYWERQLDIALLRRQATLM